MRKLTWFTSGFAAVCLLCCYSPMGQTRPFFLGTAVFTLVVLALWMASRRSPDCRQVFAVSRRALALGLGSLLACGWFTGWTALFKAPADALAGRTLTLSGTVVSCPMGTSIGGYSMTVALDGGPTAPDILLYGSADWGDLNPGDWVTFTARLAASDQMYGSETTYYTAKGLFLLGYCNDVPKQVERCTHTPLRYWPARCAKALKDSLTAALDTAAGPLAVAVTTGDKAGLPDQLRSALNRSGVAHTVAVSGMHISFLVAAALALTRNRRRTAIFFVPLLLFYALMAGGTPSAFRAVIMQTVFLAAPILRRENDAPTSLSFALLVLLVCNPYAAGSVSLQLSFTSVAGILTAAGPLSKWMLHPVKHLRKQHNGKVWTLLCRLLTLCAVSVSVSLSALLFAQPVLCLYFRQASLVFPLTNLLILWAVTLFFGCALMVGTLGIFLPGLAAWLGVFAALPGRYIIWVVSALGRWRFAAVDTGNFYYFLCLAAVYLFLCVWLLLKKDRLRPFIPLGCLILLLSGALFFSRISVTVSDLTVAALNVGQGSSTALLSGTGTCLVDCGGNSSDNAGDIAADYFASLGTVRLDLLVLTHFDSDHFNGVEQLFDRMDVAAVAIPDVETAYGQREELLELAETEGAAIYFVTELAEYELGGAVLTLYPPLGSGTSNEEGLFILCSAGDFDTLITGDADSFVEKMLVKYYNIPDIELLIVGHHGSSGSTSEELLDAVLPELAIISAGYNTYGHPAPDTLDRLAEHGVEIYRTDTMGSVTIYARSDGYAAQTQN